MYELPKEYSGKLLCHFDCAAEYPPEQYFQSEGVSVKKTLLGSYREVPDAALLRFGYRFSIEHPGKPHMMIIAYPDDKRRFMCINDGTGYDLTTGVYTGDIYPISGEKKYIYNIFWPRNNDCSITFSNVGEGEPAAAFGFSVYELDELSDSEIKMNDGRSFGIQYEDPCGQGISEGAVNFDDWLNRHIDYMHHSGQNRFVYPIVWYHGPQFPSETQPTDTFDWVEAPADRKQYFRTTTNPNDWVEQLLSRFDDEGLEFVASMTMLRLGNLMKNMNVDLGAIKAGKPTYNNMRSDGQVQASTGDWTCEYNMRNYPDLLNWITEGKSSWDYPYIYGEHRGPFGAGPMFNPLHPEVQKQVLNLISEVVSRYSKHSSLKGISLNFWHATILWFGTLESGYDDYTVGQFEKDMRISLDVALDDTERFSKRAAVLTTKYLDMWIKWRCEKITEFICKIRDITLNAGLTLILNFWNETSRGFMVGDAQYGSGMDQITMLKNGGIDFKRLSKEDGIELSVETNMLRDRGKPEGAKASLEKSRIFHDIAFMDNSWSDVLKFAEQPGSFLFNCWVECWGNHTRYPCEKNDTNIPVVKRMYGKEAEFIFRENCFYPDDGFWWDSQSRITALFPVYPYYLEPDAFSLAKYDTFDITRGGLYLDKANTAQTLDFSRSFRALPKKRFETVGKRTDPVAVRQLKYNGKLYFYAVNIEPYPITVKLELNRKSEVTQLWSGEVLSERESLTLVLDAFSLKSFAADIATGIVDYEIEISDDIENKLIAQAKELMELLENADENVEGIAELISRVKSSIQDKEYAFLRHAMQSYIVCKLKEKHF